MPPFTMTAGNRQPPAQELPMTATDPLAASIDPTPAQRKWLRRGLTQAGGKLPLFDESGRRVSARMVQSCMERGWAEPWFANPLMPNWLVCRLTEAGRKVVARVRETQLQA